MTRSSSSNKQMGSPFCIICNKKDDESNLWAAGMLGATKNAVDTQHNSKLTERWKDMAIKTNNNLLLAKPATGSLVSNELFYHLDCYSLMSQNYQWIIERKDQHQIEEHWIKATSFESIITFIIEEEESQKGLSLVVRELNEMYIHMLREHGISEIVNTTRFVAKKFFFSVRVFFHGHWQLIGQQGKGGDHFLFHFITSTRSRTFRYLFATLHVRWLSHIFNPNAFVYQTATRWYLQLFDMILSSLYYKRTD